jgi:hypothetical protein
MYWDIVSARYEGGFRIYVEFEDGKSGVADLSRVVQQGGVFEPLRDPERFRQFRVHPELRVLTWDDEVDIAPETLHHLATGEPLPAWMEADAESPKTA